MTRIGSCDSRSPAVAFAVAVYLLPASVQIVAWPGGGPERMALLPPLSRAWWSLLVGVALFGALAVTARRSPEQFRRRSHAVLPAALLLAWLIPFLPWLPDRGAVAAGAGGTAAVGRCGGRSRLDSFAPDADADVGRVSACRDRPVFVVSPAALHDARIEIHRRRRFRR